MKIKYHFRQLPLLENYPSRKEWENACWRQILKSKELLSLFTTLYERHGLVMRVAAAEGLLAGKTYREISKDSFVSPQMIRAAKKALEENGYKSYFERSKTERKKKIYGSGLKHKPKSGHIGDIGFYRKTKYGKVWMPL